MKSYLKFLCAFVYAVGVIGLSSCEDDISQIGDSLVRDEIVITIDSVGFKLTGHSVEAPVIDSRSTTNMVGNLDVAEFGQLNCSFVSRLMPVSKMAIPDTITVDSVAGFQMKISIPRASVTGDSTVPQKLKVYELTSQLPDSITSNFNPTGFYSQSSLLGTKSYTGSSLALSDKELASSSDLTLNVDLPIEKGKEIFTKYRENPEIFSWPSTFAKYFPGIYVENSFGRGCIISISQLKFNLLYRILGRAQLYNEEDSTYYSGYAVRVDTATIFSTAPEVLSSNNISLTPSAKIKNAISAGEVIVQSPAGYNASIHFPAQEIVDSFKNNSANLSIVNNLILTIPAESPDEEFGIETPPQLLMVKTSELKNFFDNNKIPDEKTSFWANYSSTNKNYVFSSMREYIVNLIKSNEPVAEEDMEFTLVPVTITTESDSTGSTTYVISCTPYQLRPALARLDIENAEIRFTFSNQQIY